MAFQGLHVGQYKKSLLGLLVMFRPMGFHKKAIAAVTGVAGATAHRKVSEQTDDNSGVEASHDAEIAVEQVFRQVPRRISAAKTTEDTVSVKDKTQKFYQKQRYKKAYKEAKRTGKIADNTAALP